MNRLGEDSHMVVTGDITQIDLPRPQLSGVIQVKHFLHGIAGIEFHYFTSTDVVRPPLVQRIIEAYDRFRHPISAAHEADEVA